MKITFLGAAGEVTGSQHLIETDERRLLLDCGFFQGPRRESRLKNEQFRCEPTKLDGVILSHAHIDHCGNLPGLYKAGFRGPIFCTPATEAIAHQMLRDSAKIQAEDARYLRKKLKPGHPPIEPLYDDEHVREMSKLIETVPYHEWHQLADDVRLRFSDAGHILGSAITELELTDHGETRRIVFTGDLGRRGMPLLRDPEGVGGCDVLITECLYGSRVHPPPSDIKEELLRLLKEAAAVGGRVIIPAFSLGRTQQVVYYLNELFNEGALPALPIFVDSPLATRLTSIFREFDHLLDAEVQQTLQNDADAFGFESLVYTSTRDESIALNGRKGAYVVISASGMCENGRVVHHLKHAVADERNTIVLLSYQAPHTLGRQLQEQRDIVRIFDREIPLRAHVERLEGLSAHADVQDFKWWYEQIAIDGGIGQAFLVHGEVDSAENLSKLLRNYCDEEPLIPRLYESFDV